MGMPWASRQRPRIAGERFNVVESGTISGFLGAVPGHLVPPSGIDFSDGDGGMAMSWRRIRQRLLEQVSEALEMPGDVLPDLPRIVLIGDGRLLVENHRGIGLYQADSVRIGTSCGDLLVRGESLVVKNILPEEITVEGRIREIAFLPQGGGG